MFVCGGGGGGGHCMFQTQLLAVVVFYIKHVNKFKLLFYRVIFSNDTVHILHVNNILIAYLPYLNKDV